MQTYLPRNLNTNVRYEKIKLKVDLRRALNSLTCSPLIESSIPQMPQVLRDARELRDACHGSDGKGDRNDAKTKSSRKEPDTARSIQSLFAETARVKRAIKMFKKGA